MRTELYPHKIAAVYPHGGAAEAAVMELNTANLDNVQVVLLAPGAGEAELAIEPDPTATRDTVTRDAVTGAAAGTLAGAAAAGAAAVVAPTLFVSAPVVGSLIVLGYGAVIGGTAGAIHGLRLREGVLAGLVKDALKAGYYVVLVHAADDEAQRRAREIVDETVTENMASA